MTYRPRSASLDSPASSPCVVAAGSSNNGCPAVSVVQPQPASSGPSGAAPESGPEQDRCAICLCDMEAAAATAALTPLPCAHMFHTACIMPWVQLKALCPLCKTPVPAGALVPAAPRRRSNAAGFGIGTALSLVREHGLGVALHPVPRSAEQPSLLLPARVLRRGGSVARGAQAAP